MNRVKLGLLLEKTGAFIPKTGAFSGQNLFKDQFGWEGDENKAFFHPEQTAFTGLSDDSRDIEEGDLFLPPPDERGPKFSEKALESGAVAIVISRTELDLYMQKANWTRENNGISALENKENNGISALENKENNRLSGHENEIGNRILICENREDFTEKAVDLFYKMPVPNLKIGAITGTNGKTTGIYLFSQIMEKLGKSCARIGTTGNYIGGKLYAGLNTTPAFIPLRRLIYKAKAQKDQFCIMEASSHGLNLGRMKGLYFSSVAFTNLTRDHLDFHGDMEAYFQAKARLFKMLDEGGQGFVNGDDIWGQKLLNALKGHGVEKCQRTNDIAMDQNNRFAVNGQKKHDIGDDWDHKNHLKQEIFSFGLGQENQIRAVNIQGAGGLEFDIKSPWGKCSIRTGLYGDFNIYNILCAFGLLISFGIKIGEIEEAFPHIIGAPGRFQRVNNKKNINVLVDYAHTPSALEAVLKQARLLTKGRLFVVFGCGGNRDKGKRPLMGQIASLLADQVVLTDDNPRFEDSQSIISQILEGIENQMGKVVTEKDREAAIILALSMAKDGDTVLIAGKGHEEYQEIQGKRIPFSDIAIVEKASRI